MRIVFSRAVSEIRYAIRELAPLARRLETEGKGVIYLNIGDPLKYDFETPSHIIDAMYEAAKDLNANYYSPSQGLPELRSAIAEDESKYNKIDLSSEDIVVTQGVSEGIQFVCRALLEEGDEVLVPSPSYPLYLSMPVLVNARPIEYRLYEDEGWVPDIEDMRKKISERTKLIVIINPNNPTGALYSEKVIREIVDLAGEFGIPILSDEIYNRIIYGGKFVSPATVSKDVPVIVLNGFSKAYLMTGWRLGYLYMSDPSREIKDVFIEHIVKLAMNRLSPNTPAQYGALAALRGERSHIKEMVDKIKRRVDRFVSWINDIDGMSVVEPQGAFYIFPRLTLNDELNDREFVIRLLKNYFVFVVYGSGFGSYGSKHIRIVTLPPIEIIDEAMERISVFMKNLQKIYR